VEAVVVILRNGRKEAQRSKTIFINAVDLVTRERAISYLNLSHQIEILSAYKDFKNKPGLASVRSTNEIKENDYSLAIPLYVERLADTTQDDAISVQQSYNNWIASANASNAKLVSLLNKFSEGKS
jgi:type I restriction enzyme M protein